MSNGTQIVFTAPQTAELQNDAASGREPGAAEVAGQTLVTLVSPGTELNFGYMGSKFPYRPGYAGVMRVTSVGAEVHDLRAGDVVFGMLAHQSSPVVPRKGLLKVPEGLSPADAVFARLIGVSMTTLTTTRARPAERVLVMGLGPVGNLAAQAFHAAGYRVTCVDPIAERCQTARECGLRDVRSQVGPQDKDLAGQVALVLECSGHEQAALTGCQMVKKAGEVVLIGVPWKKLTDLTAHELLHTVFHKYATLRSGWEWQVPREPTPFVTGSNEENFSTALLWLSEGRIQTRALAETASPADCQRVYQDLLNRRSARPVTLFNWQDGNG